MASMVVPSNPLRSSTKPAAFRIMSRLAPYWERSRCWAALRFIASVGCRFSLTIHHPLGRLLQLIIITHRCCRNTGSSREPARLAPPHLAQLIINIAVDDDERAGMRLAWVPGGIQAGVFARAPRGPHAPTPGPALSGAGEQTAHARQASKPLTPAGPANDRPAARNLLALPP